MTVETYVDATLTQFPSRFSVVERESVSLNRYQAERLTIEALINGREIIEIMYLIKEQNSVWVVTFSTGQDEFDQ